ncbi:MAG TPA: type II 3-dehydroquinate dehydratase [Negativicutes bacterium]|nr:type II 3-dehydroquinate dehydratase [Negativicutes bacterium]
MKIMVINGPNLNMLGIREKNIYGQVGYEDICTFIGEEAGKLDATVEIVQSNSEGELVDHIQRAYSEGFDGIVINPAAYTHYSIAIYDAIKAVNLPAVEIHLSNINAREEYRKVSVTAPACIGAICGFGYYGYKLALEVLCRHIRGI